MLIASFFYADFHAVFGDHYVLLLHLLVGGGLYIAYYQVDMVSHESKSAEDDE